MLLEPYIYGCDRVRAPADWSSMKWQACNRLYVIYGGSAWYMEGGRERPFLPGHLYLFPMKAAFQVRHLPEDRSDQLYFDFSLFPPLRTERVIDIDLAADTPQATAVGGTVKGLEWLMSQPRTPRVMQTVTATLNALLQQICLSERVDVLRDARVEGAIQRIHALRADGSLDLPDNGELAAAAHVTVNHFIRLFRQEMGMSPYQYILNHRLNVAAARIQAGYSMAEVAPMVGYESATALSHALCHHRAEKRG